MIARHYFKVETQFFICMLIVKTVYQNQKTPSFIYNMKTHIDSHRKTSSIKLSRTSMSLTELKKRTDNHTSQNKNMLPSQTSITKRDSHSRGRLRLGAVYKPNYILSKDERNNPFFRGNNVINEQVLNKKGVLGLITVGAIKKNADYMELLNNKYQIVQKQVQLAATFMTNPIILINTYQQASRAKGLQLNNNLTKQQKKEQKEQQKAEQKAEQKNRRTKIRSSKKKVIKKEESFVIVQQKIKLNFINGEFEDNNEYKEFTKQLNLRGMKTLFSLYEQKVKRFAQQYSLKKFTVIPDLNETKKITDRDIVKSIENAKLLGVNRKLKGSALSILANLVVMKVNKIRFSKIKQAVRKLQRIKGKFKIKKFYREMLDRRWGYLTFKLGAFAESQRRAMELAAAKPEVEVHLISSDRREQELNTFYKCRERRMTHLLRLYNNEADHMILIVDHSFNLTQLLQQIEQMPSTWKKPQIHIIHSNLAGYSVEETADLYFGLRAQDVMKVKSICRQKKAFLIPHRISQYLPHITEILSLTLFAGSFRESSKSVLFEDEADTSHTKDSSIVKFTKIKNSSTQIARAYKEKLKKVQLSNRFFQSKEKAKALFISLGIRTPLSLSLPGMNQRDFFKEFVKMILREKDQNSWVLKLPNSTFSRGLAFFETDSLKILKDNKKKAVVKAAEIEEISKLIESILVQKIMIPHNSLLTGEQFLSCFKETGGYIESYLQNRQSVCIFGRIELNGLFTLLGSYKRYYAQKICFGAIYPGIDVTKDLLHQIRQICSQLYKQNVFGYITLQLLVDNTSNEICFIDMVPHLQVFSELYFYYKRLLNIDQIDYSVGALGKKIFYIPFIDNNGNKTNSWQEFQNQLIDRKITFNEKQIIGTKFLSLSTTFLNSTQAPLSTPAPPQLNSNNTEHRYFQATQLKKSRKSADVLSMICIERDQGALVHKCLQSLNFLVSVGGQFNKFVKNSHSTHSDGLYLLDIIWRVRQLKREMS